MMVLVQGKREAIRMARELAQSWQPAFILASNHELVWAVTNSISECSRLSLFGYAVTKMVAKVKS